MLDMAVKSMCCQMVDLNRQKAIARRKYVPLERATVSLRCFGRNVITDLQPIA